MIKIFNVLLFINIIIIIILDIKYYYYFRLVDIDIYEINMQ